MKNKDWGRGRGGGGLINFPPLKRGGLLERGGLFERGRLIEDLRYAKALAKIQVRGIFRIQDI